MGDYEMGVVAHALQREESKKDVRQRKTTRKGPEENNRREDKKRKRKRKREGRRRQKRAYERENWGKRHTDSGVMVVMAMVVETGVGGTTRGQKKG